MQKKIQTKLLYSNIVVCLLFQALFIYYVTSCVCAVDCECVLVRPCSHPVAALCVAHFWLGSFSISLLSMFLCGTFMLSLNLVWLAYVYYIAMDFISTLLRLKFFFSCSLFLSRILLLYADCSIHRLQNI